MATFVHGVVFLVLAFHLLLVNGNRDLEAELDALLLNFDEMKISHQKEIAELRREHQEDIRKLREEFSQCLSDNVADPDTASHVDEETKIENQRLEENSGKKILKRPPKTAIVNMPINRRNIGDFSERAAFYAYLSQNVADLGTNQMIVFDHVITNVGNVYNNITGVFYCDRAGTYVFHVHLMTMPQHTVFLVLMKNNERVAYIYSASTDNTYSHGGNTAVLQLNRGDSVLVRAHDHATSDGVVIDQSWTSFSGFLLYPDDIEPAIVG